MGEEIRALIEQHKPRLVALSMSRVPDIEYSALQLLVARQKRASEQDPALWLVRLNPGVLEVVRRCGLADRLGPERLLYNARTAIERFLAGEEKSSGKPG